MNIKKDLNLKNYTIKLDPIRYNIVQKFYRKCTIVFDNICKDCYFIPNESVEIYLIKEEIKNFIENQLGLRILQEGYDYRLDKYTIRYEITFDLIDSKTADEKSSELIDMINKNITAENKSNNFKAFTEYIESLEI